MMEDKTLNRREVLKKVGAVAVTPMILTGNASGRSSSEASRRAPVEEQYLSQNALEAAIRTHAGELVRELAQRNLLASPSVNDLPLEKFDVNETHLPPDEAERKVAVTSVPQDEGDERTALIMVSEATAKDRIGLYVQPEAEKAYAIVYPEDDSAGSYKLDYSTNEIIVQDQECPDKVECDEGEWCDFNQCLDDLGCGYYTEVHYECYFYVNPYGNGGCKCDETGTSCASGEGCYCCYLDENDDPCLGCP